MSIRTILTVMSFITIFLGLMSMVGNVHVAEFYGILGFSLITSIIIWFKLGSLHFTKKKISKNDFK